MVDASLLDALIATIGANLRREFPNKIVHALDGDHDVASPRALTPIFFGCFDWHSAVHSHWALVRLRRYASAEARARIDGWLDDSITDAGAAGELAYLARRPGFEMPYGIAWLSTLTAELAVAGDAAAARWRGRLAPLEALARDRMIAWARRLPVPIRSGEHSQSAFALALVIDRSRALGDGDAAAALADAAERMHGADRGAPIGFEPSAHDFLSPALGAAWLMARVRDPDGFAGWLDGALPDLGRGRALEPVATVDRVDGKLVHWDGLNLSRAWMLVGIADALPAGDARAPALRAMAETHGRAGVASLEQATYAGSHWLPSFAVLWLTGPLAVAGSL